MSESMGTRSLTAFKEDYGTPEEKEIALMYRQYDGYPRVHGMELAQFLSKGKVTKGYIIGDADAIFNDYNGMGDLALQTVAHFKNYRPPINPETGMGDMMSEPVYGRPQIGHYYLEVPETRGHGEEFIWTVYELDGVPHLKGETVYGGGEVFYDGPAHRYEAWYRDSDEAEDWRW